MGGERVDLDDIGRKLEALAAAGFAGAFAQQDDLTEAARIQEPALDATGDRWRDAARKHDGGDQAGADDAERDFLEPCHRGVENRTGLGHRGKADQRDGISGQHEDVTARGAIEQ